LNILRAGPISQSQCDDSNSCWKFGLLLYQYCRHLILLLEAENVFDKLLSLEATISSEKILSLIEDNWLDFYNGDQLLPTPLCLRRFLVVRSLWISGLTLRPDRSFARSEDIISRIERAGETGLSRVLEQFWSEPNLNQISKLLQAPYQLHHFRWHRHWL